MGPQGTGAGVLDVRDIVTGSRRAFTERGEHELKGVPDQWRLYALVREPATLATSSAGSPGSGRVHQRLRLRLGRQPRTCRCRHLRQ